MSLLINKQIWTEREGEKEWLLRAERIEKEELLEVSVTDDLEVNKMGQYSIMPVVDTTVLYTNNNKNI